MSVLTRTELEKLSVMYEGDKNRDASSKIRGFLFQDYVAIMSLLKKQVKYVCLECLEDVDVFFEDGTFEIIQVKYYPKASPKMKEISTDLYYQYLRLQMLQSTLIAAPRLYIHTNSEVKDSVIWLKTNIYSINIKEEQKKRLFKKMASESSLKEFVTNFDVIPQQDIKQYKKDLMEALSKAYPSFDKEGSDEEHRQLILLGLAISYLQQRYVLDDPDFSQLRVDKKSFDSYMKTSTMTKTEQTIVNYLVGVACEEYGEIINNNDLSGLQTHMLNVIYKNTVRWIKEIGKTVDGQYQLLNTFSIGDANEVSGYRKATVDARLIYMAECKSAFQSFLDYLWKIILNICQERINDETEISDHLRWLNPVNYMVLSVTDYVCLNFTEDKYIDRSVILPPVGGKFNSVKRKIVERMVKSSPKPGKWFFENTKLTKGKNYYNYSTANVNENPTVADLGEDSFYIECMDCIGIDETEWSIKENCSDCIFSEKCVKEEV